MLRFKKCDTKISTSKNFPNIFFYHPNFFFHKIFSQFFFCHSQQHPLHQPSLPPSPSTFPLLPQPTNLAPQFHHYLSTPSSSRFLPSILTTSCPRGFFPFSRESCRHFSSDVQQPRHGVQPIACDLYTALNRKP